MQNKDKYDYGMQKNIAKKRKYGDYFADKKMSLIDEKKIETPKEFKRFRHNPSEEQPRPAEDT